MRTEPRSAPPAGRPPILRSRAWVAPLCWTAVLLDGFDAVVLGAVLPSMLENGELGMTTAQGTAVATAGLVGMMIGALAMGYLTDRLGRRKMLIGAVVVFSVLTFAAAFSPNVLVFGLLRFLAGLGLGGCLPTAIAMVTEFARRGRGSNATTLVMTGYHVGAVLTAAIAIVVVRQFGWQEMFVLGALPALVLVPLMVVFLPESPSWIASQGRSAEARTVGDHYGVHVEHHTPAEGQAEKAGASMLLSTGWRRNSIAVWIASFMGLLLVYGLNTWLPQIMRAADYDLGNSLGFLLILNVGAIVGLTVAGRVADRITPRVAGAVWFLGSALLLAALAIKLPLLGIYAMVLLTGFFVFSSQVLVYAFTAANHPPRVRATALGMSAGVGRLGAISGPIVGGTLLSAGLAYPWGFFAFAAVGALGGVAMTSTRTRHDLRESRH